MMKKELISDEGHVDTGRIRDSYNDKIKIHPLKSLEVLSGELSQQYGKNVVVIDILEQDAEQRKIHSMITGKTFDEFLNGYEFNNSNFSQISVDFVKGLNAEKHINERYSISLVYRTK